ncbi:hypothetical protein [Kaistia terrae]|uniref:DUF1902 domain-containing protein n=1 Tax=Kaistia terrae TaxID=537017 RepID=A0ABW0Q2G1_9HYPH|nr:hypothetical protein [Kaistia terrae]MCX5581507.1 hypothetical protein [Kaistia terrae]
MPTDDEDDITVRLSLAALDPESVEPSAMAELLLDALDTIETLRTLIGIRAEIELEDIEPEGNA